MLLALAMAVAEDVASRQPLLDPPTRAVLLMSLLAFVVLGLGLVGGVMLGGKWARRSGSVDLRKPLPLRRAPGPRQEREPAMLRGVHWDKPGDTTPAAGANSETISG
jgi:hypothetical protein